MKVKKIMALIMVAIVAVMAIPVSASADTLLEDKNVSINVECGKKGYTFECYQVATLDSTTASPYETSYTTSVDAIKTDIKNGNTKSALAHLDELDTLPASVQSYGSFDTDTATEFTFSDLPQGIYYIKAVEYPADVTAVQNSILALPYYGENGWIYEYKKVDLAEKVVQNPPTTNKVITNSTKNNENYTDVSLGDEVSFKLTNTTTGSKQIKLTSYAVYDDMSKGLTLDKNSISVYLAKADGTKVEDIAKTNYSVNVTKEAEGENTQFNVALSRDYLALDNYYNDGVAAVIVEYKATLNQYAVKGIKGNPNEDVKLQYGNRSKVDSVPGNTVYVYTYGIGVEKLDENNNHLAGAEFALYESEQDAQNKQNAIATGTSDQDGNVVFTTSNGEDMKVASGKYYIVETKAPADYNVYGKVIPIDVNVEYQDTFANNTYVANAPANGIATCTVTDSKLTAPQTGGYVEYLYFAGIALIAISLPILYAVNKSKKKAEIKANTDN